MRSTILLLAVLLSSVIRVSGQTRTICGRVIAEDDLFPIPGVLIKTPDKLLVGTTNRDGKFKIDIPQNTPTLLFSWIGYETAIIKLNSNCDTVDVIMIEAGTYDFMSSGKIDKLRLERFNRLPELQLQAYKKGLFTKESVCYTREFKPDKPVLDSISKEIVKTRKKVKLTFKKLNVGDTVRIPFSDAGGSRADGTDRTTLTAYSSYSGGYGHHSGCIITCIIMDKNRHRRLYNLVCKIVKCDRCKYPSIYNDIVMKPDVVFTYDMKYGEILGTQNFNK